MDLVEFSRYVEQLGHGLDRANTLHENPGAKVIPPASTEQLMTRMTEELGELAKACRRLGRPRALRPDDTPGTLGEVMDEVGDCLFVLTRIAVAHRIDMGLAAQLVLDKIERRLGHAEGE